MEYEVLLKEIQRIAGGPGLMEDKLLAVCKLLADGIQHYDWVGFYLVDESGKKELVLGPFIGKPTEHKRIPYGKGICGQAAERKETFVVQDVSQETNYLSCSPDVKSEIVIPILKEGEVKGELDIDSHELAPFTEEERGFLERVCAFLSKLF